jgi:hypothetical protein
LIAALSSAATASAGARGKDLFERARKRFKARDLKGALEACEAACSADASKADYAGFSVWIRASMGNADFAALTAELDALLAAHGGSAALHFFRGMLRKRVGDETGATQDLSRAHEIDPNHSGAARELAKLKRRRTKPPPSLRPKG